MPEIKIMVEQVFKAAKIYSETLELKKLQVSQSSVALL